MADQLTQRIWGRCKVSAIALLATGIVAGAAQAQTLNFTVMESGTGDAAAAAIADTFTADTGIAVNISAFPWAVLRQNNTQDLISGTGAYDVMSGGYYLADVYSYFAPLDEYIARDNYADGMIDNLMLPGRSEYFEGKQVGIPYGIDAYGLLVNNEILAAAGVAPDFATWADVLAACEAIKAAVPDVACISHPTGSPEQIGAFFFSSYAGTYVDADGNYALEADEAVRAANEVAALWQHLPSNGTALSFDESHQIFKDGEAAILVTWPSFVTATLDAEDSPMRGKWELVGFPGEGFPWLSLWQLFVPQSAEDKDAAWAWIKAFAGPENAKSNMQNHSINSVWVADYQDPEMQARNAHYWPTQIAGFASAINPPLSGEAQDLLTNTVQEIANGRVSAEDGIASVNSGWQSIPVPAPLREAAVGAGLAR